MDLRSIAKTAATAQATRVRMRRAGITPLGHRLWTSKEDAIVARLYPDYSALRKALRNRTHSGIRHRVSHLGIAIKRHLWTSQEKARLRRLYPTADRAALLREFPALEWKQIESKVLAMKLYKARKRPSTTGIPIIDSIRARAFELNLSMVELDAMAWSKSYFQKAGWRRGIRRTAVYRAIEALDGQVVPVWR